VSTNKAVIEAYLGKASDMLALREVYRPTSVAALSDLLRLQAAWRIVTLLGANGAGKTTTLNCIMGLQRWTRYQLTANPAEPQHRPDRAAGIYPRSRKPRAVRRDVTWKTPPNGAYIHGLRCRRARDGGVFDLFPELRSAERIWPAR